VPSAWSGTSCLKCLWAETGQGVESHVSAYRNGALGDRAAAAPVPRLKDNDRWRALAAQRRRCPWQAGARAVAEPAVRAELENHLHISEKTLAEFIIELSKGRRTSRDFAEVRARRAGGLRPLCGALMQALSCRF